MFQALLLGFAIFLAVMIGWSIYEHEQNLTSFRDQCVAAGGHIYGQGLKLCLTDDGRLIEVIP